MYFALECLQILLLCAASLCGDGKTHTIYHESVVPPGTTSISLDVNLSVNAFNALLEHSRETIVEVDINDVPITSEHYRTICRLSGTAKSVSIRMLHIPLRLAVPELESVT